MLLLIFWSYCGYVILLFIFSILYHPKTNNKESLPTELPKIAIIIPCYNEEAYVKQKIANLKELDYQRDKLEIFFLNGPSTDKTSEEIANLIAGVPNWHLIETSCRGKINQMNYGLSKIRSNANIIVSTDMDAILEPEVLIKFVSEFNSDSKVAVVGANISPRSFLPLEEDHWRSHNLLRILESNFYTSSIVVAPCYAYKSSLIECFPQDCVADDIFIAFKANTEGYLTKYIESARGIEVRSPASFGEFFCHKFRKGNAYLIEIFRFLYRLPYMPRYWKIIYLTKFLQLAVIPWVLPYFLLSTISIALSSKELLQFSLFSLILLFASFLLTSFLFSRGKNKYLERKSTKGSTPLYFIVNNIILILIGLSYPFYRQTSSYQKINSNINS
jgi:cellulose synthase/poly-beta-1,6-N-acetylglucosamine synthase-like glycosyltransferase